MAMLTGFGKFCRRLRIDRDEILLDMANKLGVSVAFLSGVENGKRKPPKDWESKIIQAYNLTGKMADELKELIYEAQNDSMLDVSNLRADDKKLVLEFARKIEAMSPEDKQSIRSKFK